MFWESIIHPVSASINNNGLTVVFISLRLSNVELSQNIRLAGRHRDRLVFNGFVF